MKNVVGGMLLVAGTSIGAGMLALPVVTAAGGFVPAFWVYLMCWMFMTCTGLLLLELCLKLEPDANLVSMAGAYLGRGGKVFAWILYLFLFYCLSIAYVSVGGSMLQEWFGGEVWFWQAAFTAVLGGCVYGGARVVGRINGILMVGLIASYVGFVALGVPHVKMGLLGHGNWRASLVGLPVVFTSFSYQGVIPSLVAYLKRDARAVRVAILGGTSIAFVIYLIWEFLILGIVPLENLERAAQMGQSAVAPLGEHVATSGVRLVGQAFAFFAITTSFLGVTLGLMDFLADGLKVVKKGWRKVGLALVTFGPPFLVALVNPNLFLIALTLAGGIGCALLLGFLPAVMAWRARYGKEGHGGPLQLGGGRIVLGVLFLFVLFELAMEIGAFH
jgi:tyrosine-specific transport protein